MAHVSTIMNHIPAEMDVTSEMRPDKKIVVTIVTDEPAAVRLLEVIHLLLGISDRVIRSVKNTASYERAQAQVQAQHEQQQAIARSYYQYRQKGYKHRTAMACVQETELAKSLNYTKTEIGACVRAFPEQALVLSLIHI